MSDVHYGWPTVFFQTHKGAESVRASEYACFSDTNDIFGVFVVLHACVWTRTYTLQTPVTQEHVGLLQKRGTSTFAYTVCNAQAFCT